MSADSKLLVIYQAKTYCGSVENAFDNAREVGHFSRDGDRKVHFDRSQMKYYVPRTGWNLYLDLNVGYENRVKGHYDPSESMANLLQWIWSTRFDPKRYDLDFVCSRGVIQKLLCTPFTSKSFGSWCICASRLDDIIYLEKFLTDDEIREQMNRTERQNLMSSWGYRFEQYITADEPDGVPNVSSNTHEVEEFCIVVTNRMGPYKMLIRAETDAADARGAARPGSGDTSCYVEIKTSKAFPDFRSSYQFKNFKSLPWWAQSVTVGIKKIVCGLRDDDGIVQSIEEFGTSDLPRMCDGSWDPNVCFKFCNNFLEYLKNTLKENNHRIVYKFEYSGGSQVSVTRLYNPEGQHRVIPDWYVERCGRQETSHLLRL